MLPDGLIGKDLEIRYPCDRNLDLLPMTARTQFLLFNLGIPLLFVVTAWSLIPIADVFQFSSDEGMELAKVDLYARGYQLYTQIWNDQPPLPTVLWSGWLQIFGHSILSARLLTLGFGTLLVWAFTHCIRLTSGIRPALLGGIGLIFSNHLIELSSAVMMGVPSLALALFSLYAVLQAQFGQTALWLLVSAISFALSAQIKAFSLFLVPVLLLYLALRPAVQARLSLPQIIQRVPWRQVVLWLMGFAIATVILIDLLPQQSADQTLGNHFNASLRQAAGWQYGIGRLLEFLIKDPDYWLLLPFTAIALRRQSVQWGAVLLPLLWLLATILVLLWHRPIHYHYYLLISIPLTWLAALGAHQALTFLQKRTVPQRPIILKMAGLCLALCLLGIPVKGLIIRGQGQYPLLRSPDYFALLPQLTARSNSQWLFTDVLMYGFYAQVPVPPEIAVFSAKRMTAGNLSVPELQGIVERYQPDQIVLGRFPEVEVGLRPQLNRDYTLIRKNDKVRYFQRQALPAPETSPAEIKG